MSVSALDAIAADIKPLDSNTSPREIHGLLSEHRAALRAMSGDLAEQRQARERMMGDFARKLDEAKRASGAEYVPAGDASLMDARYLLEDGGVRIGRTEQDVVMPDGAVERYTVQGVLTDIPVTREQADMQRAYMGLCAAADIAGRSGGRPDLSNPIVKSAWRQFSRAAMSLPGETGRRLRRMFTDPAEMKRAISNSSGTGAELISVPTISVVRRPADLARRLVSAFPSMEVMQKSFKRPIVTGRALAKKRGTTTDDPARYPVRTFTTSDDTVTMVDQELTALVDPLWLEDAASTIADPMGLVTGWLAEGWADSWELAFLHGDTAGTHQDTLASWTVGGYYTAGDLSGSNSPVAWWIGLRARAVDDSNTVSAGGSFDASDHFGALELLGTHAGREPIIITGLHALYTQLLDYSEFLTLDKLGSMATLITGEIGSIGSTPVVISQFISNDFDSSSGVYTGSNASTEMVYTSRSAWVYYDYVGTSQSRDFDVERPERGARYVGMVRRGLFSPVCLSTEKPAAILYNL